MKNRHNKTRVTAESVSPNTVQEPVNIMSDTTKLSAPKSAIPTPEMVLSEDLLQLQLKYKDFQLATLQQKVALQDLEKAVDSARSDLVKLNDAINQKYKLDPSKDRINLQDGLIVRG